MGKTMQKFTELFYYKGGHLYNKVQRGARAKRNQKSAYFDKSSGYMRVRVFDKTWLEHRIIFYLHHKHLPKIIDHINGVKTDNRIENLRDAIFRRNNTVNSKIRVDNSSGYRGVHNHRGCNGWVAQGSNREGRRVHLGTYLCIKEAALAYNHHAESTYGPFATFNQVF